MTTSFPGLVWASPLLKGLDERGRREVEAAGALLELAAGTKLFSEGEPSDAVFVIVSGEVEVLSLGRGHGLVRVKRRAGSGDSVGEEALLGPHAVRDGEARAVSAVRAASVPFVVLERSLVRAGGSELAERTGRAIRRRLLERRLRDSGLVDARDEAALGALLDAATYRDLERGEVLYEAGEMVSNAVLVLDGLLATRETDDEGKLVPVGYLGRSDLFFARGPRTDLTLSAAGPSSLAVFPARVVARHVRESALERASRGKPPERAAVDPKTTAHVVHDLYRVQIARSLLVIDQDACTRCGHCVWSCGNAHDDGVPRLTRRGDKLLVPSVEGAVPLLLPNSCQHCKNPSCLKDCPTGAIVRDGRGEVKIREDLCTGCGNCARGCPWENIQIVPRAEKTPAKGSADGPTFADVAVKCDLCEGLTHGPACVAACPTEAIVRLDPDRAGVVSGRSVELVPEGRRPAYPWVVLALGVGLGVVRLVPVSPMISGIVAATLCLASAAYLAPKRRRPSRNAKSDGTSRSRTRPHYVAHLALGTLATVTVLAHARGLGSATGNAAFALFAVAVLAGALAGIAYVFVPSRLSKLEREGALPEDLPGLREDGARRLFRALSGKSEVVKKLYDKILAPYRASRLGPVALVLSGRSVGAEERAVLGRVETLLEGRGKDKLGGLATVVRLTVEQRALSARAFLGSLLVGLVPVHLFALAAFAVVLVAHVVAVVARAR